MNDAKPVPHGWKYCDECQGLKPGTHAHDEFEALTREELLACLRAVSGGSGGTHGK